MDEVAVEQCLQAKVGEGQVTLWPDGCVELLEIVLGQACVEQFEFGGTVDIGLEVVAIDSAHLLLGCDAGVHLEEAEGLAAHGVEQQARRDMGVVGFLVDEGARGHDQCLSDVLLADAVEEILAGGLEDFFVRDVLEPLAGLADERLETRHVKRRLAAVGQRDVDDVLFLGRLAAGSTLLGTLVGLLLAVEDIGTRDLVLAGTHEREFDLVLDVLDVDGSAVGHAAGQGVDDLVRQVPDGLVDAWRGGGAATLDGQEGLGQGDCDLAGVEVRDLAVATDHVEFVGGQVFQFFVCCCGRNGCRRYGNRFCCRICRRGCGHASS